MIRSAMVRLLMGLLRLGTRRGRRAPSRARQRRRGGSASSSPGREVVEQLGVAEHPLVVDPAAEHVRPQLVGSGQAHRGHHLHRLLPRTAAGSGRPARSCPATSRARIRLGSWVATPDRAGVGVAGLGLDAADRHHHRARGVGVVGALHHPLDDVDAGGDLAAGADLDPVAQADADQRVVHRQQSLGQRRADVVLVLQRRRAGAALAAVDDRRSRASPPRRPSPCRWPRKSTREPRQSLKPAGLPPASSRIRATNSTSSRGVENTRWYDGDTHFSPFGTPRASAISWVTLAPGSTPPMPGLAPWLSLSETILTWSSAAVSRELVRVEVAVLGAGAEVAAADLPDQVAALAVVRAEPALAGVVGEAARAGARG